MDDKQFFEVMVGCLRAQALEDGNWIDVTEQAEEAGFRCPVAVTRAVWQNCVEPPPGDTTQDQVGRLRDLLNAIRFAALAEKEADVLKVEHRVWYYQMLETFSLDVICDLADPGVTVVTVFLRGED